MKRLFIAAPKSGSGKTSITIALLETLKRRGLKCVSFKCGPDYIDPLFHKTVLGIPSYNLDTFFTNEEQTRELFREHSAGFDISVTEGVMGLYDGMGGMSKEGSSYHLASVTGDNIILVLDAKGACRSLLPVIEGFISYDDKKLIKGVILNRCSKAVYEKLEPEIKKLGVAPLGFMRDKEELCLPSRHLGLTLPSDIENIRSVIDALHAEFNENVNIDELLELSECEIDVTEVRDNKKEDANGTAGSACEFNYRIAVAKDEAFCFLYEDNLDILKNLGADIVFFSPLDDDAIPSDADALYFPGGYPELYAKKLASNNSMKDSIRKAYDKKIPVLAECGGFMYLHKSIEDKEGIKHETVGIIDSDCIYKGKSVRFGYIEIKEKEPLFLAEGESIRGHEFHYWDTEALNDSCTAVKPSTGKSYDCIIVNEHAWMGFPHLYFPSNRGFAENFVRMAVSYRSCR